MNNSNDLFALLLARTKSGGGGGGGGSDDYRDLSHKPQINNHTLNGSMTSADLGITSANDTTITVKVTGESDQTFTTNQSSASNITVNVPVRDVTVGGTSALDTSTHTVALGSAAGSATTDFATSAQGGKADSAVQTLTINNSATGVTKTGDAVDISAVPATIVSAGKLANNMEATTQSASDNSDKLATTKYVDTAVGNLPKPMVYTGAITLTADSTDTTKASITVTAPASVANIKEGFTYKVATIASSPVYTGTLKVGDTFIAAKNAPTVSASWVADTDWNVVPSGDEPSGTVIQVSTGAGLIGGPITTSGTIKANLQSETAFGGAATSVTPGSITTNIQPVLTDSNGKLAVKVDKSDVGLGNVTNDAQVKKISSSVNNNIVKWGGTDGATVADSGVSISTSVADNDTTVPTGKAITTELNKKQNTLTAGAGLAFGTGSASATLKAKLKSGTALADAATNSTTYGKSYAVNVDSNGDLACNVPWTDTTYSAATTSTAGLMSAQDKTDLGNVKSQALIVADQSTQYNVANIYNAAASGMIVSVSGYTATFSGTGSGTVEWGSFTATTTNYKIKYNINSASLSFNIRDMTTGTQVQEYYVTSGDTIANLTLTVGHQYSIRTYSNSAVSGAIKISIIPADIYDTGFTDFQPYALPNTKITPELIELVDSGAKNILDLSKYKEINPGIIVDDNIVFHGITWSISNSSGLTVSGTSDGSGSYPKIYSATLPIGTYYLTGGDSTIELLTPDAQRERGQGLTIEITASTAQPYFLVGYVPPNTAITGTHNIKPMLCTKAAWDVSQKYVPYRPTYEETIEQVATNKNNISLLNSKVGVKNILGITLSGLKEVNSGTWTGRAIVINGVTFTYNIDGTITADGTAGSGGANLYLYRHRNVADYDYVGATLTGCPSGGGAETYGIFIEQESSPYGTFGADTGSGVIIEDKASRDSYGMITVKGTVSNITFSPMITHSSDLTFETYSPTNRELYNDILTLQS